MKRRKPRSFRFSRRGARRISRARMLHEEYAAQLAEGLVRLESANDRLSGDSIRSWWEDLDDLRVALDLVQTDRAEGTCRLKRKRAGRLDWNADYRLGHPLIGVLDGIASDLGAICELPLRVASLISNRWRESA